MAYTKYGGKERMMGRKRKRARRASASAEEEEKEAARNRRGKKERARSREREKESEVYTKKPRGTGTKERERRDKKENGMERRERGGEEEEGEAKKLRKKERGKRARAVWDEEFSLASPRCLYTRSLALSRGSCMAVGHISVLSELTSERERVSSLSLPLRNGGAPPKNQIECKNRINSSWQARESYVRLLLSFSLLLCCTRSARFSAMHDSTSKGERERPITSHIFSYSACLRRPSYAALSRAFMKDPACRLSATTIQYI